MRIDFFAHSDQSGLKEGQSLERISRWGSVFSRQSLDLLESLAFTIGGECFELDGLGAIGYLMRN